MINKDKWGDITNISQENLWDFWADDALKAGYIKEVLYDLKPMEILPKVSANKLKVLSNVTYSPDRAIIWTPKAEGIFYTELDSDVTRTYVNSKDTFFYAQTSNEGLISFIDVKAPAGYGNRNNSDVSFQLKRSILWYKHRIFINKVMNHPNSVVKDKKTKKFKRYKSAKFYLWMSTFTPERYFYTNKTLTPRTINNWEARTIKQFEDGLLPKIENKE